MSSSKNARPKWRQLYLTFPLLIVLFLLDRRLTISTGWHQAVQIGIILFVYGLVHRWIKANEPALRNVEQEQYGTINVIKVAAYELPDEDEKKSRRPIFQLPGTEIKGTLGDTFEMDYIDAEFLPADEISQDKN